MKFEDNHGSPLFICRLRVFTRDDGEGGNPLGVVMHGAHAWPPHARSTLARRLALPELVFIDDAEQGRLEIYGHDGSTMPFAGHPLVGAGWLLGLHLGLEQLVLRPPAGPVPTWCEVPRTQWISASDDVGPPITLIRYESPEAVDALDRAPASHDFAYCWAWEDGDGGHVRARAFAPGHGVAEDEATGVAAIRLCASVGRPIAIRQGRASVLYARPLDRGRLALGGVVTCDSTPSVACQTDGDAGVTQTPSQ